jgi:hypothetical protein
VARAPSSGTCSVKKLSVPGEPQAAVIVFRRGRGKPRPTRPTPSTGLEG